MTAAFRSFRTLLLFCKELIGRGCSQSTKTFNKHSNTGFVQQGRNLLSTECLYFSHDVWIAGIYMRLRQDNVLEIERPDGFKRQLPQLEVTPINKQQSTMFWFSLTVTEGCCHCTARLGYVEVLSAVPCWLNQTLMFMSPYNQIKKIVQKLFWNVVCLAMSHTVLMYHKQTEPIIVMLTRSKHLN